VTVTTIDDPALADTTTKVTTQTYRHDGSKPFIVNQDMASWDDLAALPTGTEAFRAAVKEVGNPPNAIEKGLQELPLEGPLPLQQRQAAFEVASSMPGATTTKDTHDAKGRPAVQVSIEAAWLIDSYYFDPVTFRLLEASSFNTPEWEAHWKPLTEKTGEPLEPLGSGYEILYSDWTVTPRA
jgi:hypothetical protein